MLNPHQLSGIARRLVSQQILNENQALQADIAAREKQLSLIRYLINSHLVSAKSMAYIIAMEFGLPLLDLHAFDKNILPQGLVPEELIHKHRALPLFKRGERLYVAMVDPTNMSVLHEFRFHTGLKIHTVIVEDDKLLQLIDDTLNQHPNAALHNLSDSDLDIIDIHPEPEKELSTSFDAEDAPIVRFVHKILLDAIKNSVSDIHFERYETTYRIRFRRDGLLYETSSPPLNFAARITARLKVMARMDIAERRVPQDGHFTLALSEKHTINFRVNTCPANYGEKVVVRILDPKKLHLGIEQLGYEADQQKLFLNTLKRPQGMVLVTGPTGSGKTVSLYTALHFLNTTESNICTIEDPIEINIPGINQVNINSKAGIDFAAVLRAFLRQDPDIIMIGEIRDTETANIAIRAAQTGHLVLSTLHTNSAPETLTRLINMGVAPFNIATSMSLIISQRLARCLCATCKIPLLVPPATLREAGFLEEEIASLNLYGPNLPGCGQCRQGYCGRIGLYEMLNITPEIGHIIMNGGNAIQITAQALAQGMQTLRCTGLLKVKKGITSLEEINRVTLGDR